MLSIATELDCPRYFARGLTLHPALGARCGRLASSPLTCNGNARGQRWRDNACLTGDRRPLLVL